MKSDIFYRVDIIKLRALRKGAGTEGRDEARVGGVQRGGRLEECKNGVGLVGGGGGGAGEKRGTRTRK